MAENWIKVEKCTPGKPEVLGVAAELGIHPNEAFGLCVRFWMWCDDQLDSPIAKRVSKKVLDMHLGRDGFADALILVGWLLNRNGAVEVPNFDRHMSQSSKTRDLASQRQKASRARRKIEAMSQDVTTVSQNKCDAESDMSQGRSPKAVIPRPLRTAVYKRDGNQCRYCGRHRDEVSPPAGPSVGLTGLSIDHVIPETQGGETTEGNCVTACLECNLKKGGRTPEEAGMVLRSVSQKTCDKSVTPSLSLSLLGTPDDSRFDAEQSFDQFWTVYPSSANKQEARKAWKKAIDRESKVIGKEAAAEKLVSAARDYREFLEGQDSPPRTKYAQGWLNQSSYDNDYTEMLEEEKRSMKAVEKQTLGNGDFPL